MGQVGSLPTWGTLLYKIFNLLGEQMIQNVIIGEPVCEPWLIFSNTPEDWEKDDKHNTLFTEERFLPRILVECGVAKSVSEVRKNKPNLVIELNTVNFYEIKWGKKRVFIQVGK